MGSSLTKDEMRKIEEQFNELDKDCSGELSKSELTTWAMDWADTFVFPKMDKNGDGKVSIHEFMAFIKGNGGI